MTTRGPDLTTDASQPHCELALPYPAPECEVNV